MIKQKPSKTDKSYLNKRGYVIRKASLSFRELHKCKKNLTVMPFVNSEYSANIQPFPVYLESVNKIYIPRHFGLQEFGEPDADCLSEGQKISITFQGTLRDKQMPIVKAFLDTCQPNQSPASQSHGGIISVPCGYGKTIENKEAMLLHTFHNKD